MDDKMIALAGAVAGVTLAGRGLRPLAKLTIRGAVAAADATTGVRRELSDLYAEAKAEQRGTPADAGAVRASPPAT